MHDGWLEAWQDTHQNVLSAIGLSAELSTNFYTPCFNEVERGYAGFTSSIRLSVRPSVHLSVRGQIFSALYLPQYLPDPFHICTSYQATSEGVSHVKFIVKFQNLIFWQFFGTCNFDFVLLWHGMWYESIVWVIMGRWEYSQNAGILVVLVCFCHSELIILYRFYTPYMQSMEPGDNIHWWHHSSGVHLIGWYVPYGVPRKSAHNAP